MSNVIVCVCLSEPTVYIPIWTLLSLPLSSSDLSYLESFQFPTGMTRYGSDYCLGGMLCFCSIPPVDLLNNNAAELGNPGPMGVEHICKKPRYITVL